MCKSTEVVRTCDDARCNDIEHLGFRREAPLPDAIKGDTPCHRCGSEDFPVWWTDSDFWNAVVRSAPLPWMANSEQPNGDGLMCFTCFAVLAYERGFDIRGWVVSPVQIPTDTQGESL